MADYSRVALTTLLLVVSGTRAEPLPQATVPQQAAAQLTGEILVNGRSMDYLQSLSDGFGSRLTGTAAYQRAAEWAAGQFRAAGIKNVRLEPFTIPNGWERLGAQFRIVTPLERPVHIQSVGWSPSTPPGGVVGEVVVISEFTPDRVKGLGDEIKGRIVLVDVTTMWADGINGAGRVLATISLLKDLSAKALITADYEPNNVLHASTLSWGARLSPLPIGQIGMEDARFIKRLAVKAPVTVECQLDNRVRGLTVVNNVVAEIPGREKPGEWIIIGAHLDSWDFGTGAQDNAAGCAIVLEAARAIAGLGHAPRRSIRFALWGGEEQGLLGSTAYVRDHAGELDQCAAALNTDNGAGHPLGWKVEGRNDVDAGMREISRALEGLGAGKLSPETSFDTDHGSFMLEGIPSLNLWVDMKDFPLIHHTSGDMLDKIDAHNVAAGSAVMAVTAYEIAERHERIAPRVGRAAVSEIFKNANLEDLLLFLKEVGVWK